MNKAEQEEIDALANDLAYNRIKFSRLWRELSNEEIDARATDFANLLKLHLEELIGNAEQEIERRAEAA